MSMNQQNTPKRFVYCRVSSIAQDYAQQQNCINQYFAREGINPDSVHAVIVEKISGTVDHTERKLADLIARCESGDIIVVSELSRLGRNMSDLFAIVTECCNKGIRIIQAKDGSAIENQSIAGQALLFALGLAAEIEVKNIRQRTQMGLDVRKEWLKEQGEFISKSGRVCTHLGREKGCDITPAIEASAKSRKYKSEQWRNTSVGYAAVKRWLGQGKSRREILDEFNFQHQMQPDVYCTREGKPLTRAILCKWVKEMGGQMDLIMEVARSH